MVCLDGAVIDGTLGCTFETHIDIATSDMAEPGSATIADKRWRYALWALDAVREGDWISAFKALHGACPEGKTYQALEAIPAPLEPEFEDWSRLDTHLGSLAYRANRLRELGL